MSRILLTFNLLFWVAVTQAQQLNMSLEEAKTYALEHAYAVQYAAMDVRVAEREIKELRAIGLPQVKASVDYNNYIDIPTQVAPADAFGFPSYITDFLVGVAQETGVNLNAPAADPNGISEFQFGAAQTSTAGISVSQLIFDGSYIVGLQASKTYAEAKKGALDQSVMQMKASVAEAYHTVLIARENLSLLRASREVLAASLAETKELLINGFVEEQDADQLQLTLADLDARISYAEQQSSIALDMLKFQIGLPMTADLELSDSIESLSGKSTEDPLASPFSLQNNLDYKVQSTFVKISELSMKNEKAKALPSIGAFYNYQRNAQRDQFNFFDFDQKWYPIQLWGVQMTIPIFTGLGRHHSIEKAKIEQERSELRLEQVAAAAELEYAAARSEYLNALKNEEIQKDNLELADRIYAKTQIKYREGIVGSFDLTQAQNQWLTAQGNAVAATLQLLNAKTRLNKALSKL